MNHPTYCNPLPLPEYPRGRLAPSKDTAWGWDDPLRRDFREMADPTVLFHEGRWYLYPSGRMVYISDDFVTWRRVPMTPEDTGYAPTVVRFRGRFYLTACDAPVFVSDSPAGPFRELGTMTKPDGSALTPWLDPMLFADEDGRLYAYWGIGQPGIFGAELDPDAPFRLLTEPRILFTYDPDHLWERVGDHNEDASRSCLEGAWMLKRHGRYILTYAAPGTEFRSYAMGAYTADAPLGPFQYQDRNPILRDTEGLVNGPGHGCITEGPGGTLWAFYTCLVRVRHYFERRIGMDPAGFDEHGNLYVSGASETPQLAPGLNPRPERGNDAGLSDAAEGKPVTVSSAREGFPGECAVDRNIRTYWTPERQDREPWIRIDLGGSYDVSALRLIWYEHDLSYDDGIVPGPVRYVLEGERDGKRFTLLDRSDNDTDLIIEYRTFPAATVTAVTLRITSSPSGTGTSLTSISVFAARP